MSDIEVIKNPKHIIYNGNLYQLIDTDVVAVSDLTLDFLKEKYKEIEDKLEVNNGCRYKKESI